MNTSDDCRCPGCGQCEAARVRKGLTDNILTNQLLDLITLMPDSQTQEIVDYILSLRETRRKHANTNPNERRTDTSTSSERTNSPTK